MENKNTTVTIDLEDYNLLKKAEFMLGDLIEELIFIIEGAELNYLKSDLSILDDNLKRILKKYCPLDYQKKFSMLKKMEEEKENVK